MSNPQKTASAAPVKVLTQVCAGFAGSLTFPPWGSILGLYRDFVNNLRNLRKPAQGDGARRVCAFGCTFGVRTAAVMGRNHHNAQDSADSANANASTRMGAQK